MGSRLEQQVVAFPPYPGGMDPEDDLGGDPPCWAHLFEGDDAECSGEEPAASDPAENARADFEAGVVRITASEYETALAVAAGRATATG